MFFLTRLLKELRYILIHSDGCGEIINSLDDLLDRIRHDPIYSKSPTMQKVWDTLDGIKWAHAPVPTEDGWGNYVEGDFYAIKKDLSDEIKILQNRLDITKEHIARFVKNEK